MKFRHFIVALIAITGASNSQAQWFDSKTGQPVASGPMLATKTGNADRSGPRPGIEGGQQEGIPPSLTDPDRAFDPVSGRSFFFDRTTCTWRDSKTGQPVASGPMLATKTGYADRSGPRPGIEGGQQEGIPPSLTDPDRAFDPVSGRSFFFDRKACLPPQPKTTEQPQAGGQVGSTTPLQPQTAPAPVPATSPPQGKSKGTGHREELARPYDRSADETTPYDYVPSRELLLRPFERLILDAHNEERAKFGYQPLQWNPQLAAGAADYAETLARTGQRVHAPRQGRGDVRENLNQGMLGWNTDQMLRNWLDEKAYFTPGTFPNVCSGGWSKCGHYSQMIWPETTDIGCGMATGSGYQWLVCRYSPGGNKDGKLVGTPVRYHWIDIKTLKPVPTVPLSGVNISGAATIEGAGTAVISEDRKTAYNPKTGQNFAKEPDGSWIDIKTGKLVPTVPLSGVNISGAATIEGAGSAIISEDRKTAYNPKTGQNFAKEPVPVPAKGKN